MVMPKNVIFHRYLKYGQQYYLRFETAIEFLGLGLQFYLRFETAARFSD